MKTILYLSVLAIFSLTIGACNKNEISLHTGAANTVNTQPEITSKIFKQTNNPFAVQFGQAEAVFGVGDKVAIYLPFGVNNDVLQSATITFTDASTEEVIGNFDLLPSSHPSLGSLNVPYDLWYVPFRFVTVDIDGNYIGRTITMTTTLTGQLSSSTDVISNAFTVQ